MVSTLSTAVRLQATQIHLSASMCHMHKAMQQSETLCLGSETKGKPPRQLGYLDSRCAPQWNTTASYLLSLFIGTLPHKCTDSNAYKAYKQAGHWHLVERVVLRLDGIQMIDPGSLCMLTYSCQGR